MFIMVLRYSSSRYTTQNTTKAFILISPPIIETDSWVKGRIQSKGHYAHNWIFKAKESGQWYGHHPPKSMFSCYREICDEMEATSSIITCWSIGGQLHSRKSQMDVETTMKVIHTSSEVTVLFKKSNRSGKQNTGLWFTCCWLTISLFECLQLKTYTQCYGGRLYKIELRVELILGRIHDNISQASNCRDWCEQNA